MAASVSAFPSRISFGSCFRSALPVCVVRSPVRKVSEGERERVHDCLIRLYLEPTAASLLSSVADSPRFHAPALPGSLFGFREQSSNK